MGSIVKLSSKYQIVIPKEIRKEMHLNAGSELILEMEKDRIVVLPRPENYTRYMLGLGSEIWHGVDATNYVKQERETWDK